MSASRSGRFRPEDSQRNQRNEGKALQSRSESFREEKNSLSPTGNPTSFTSAHNNIPLTDLTGN